MERYDLVVIGAGPGGYEAAAAAAAEGLKTAVIERRQLGGTCLNRGCIPTKTLIHSAELYEGMKLGERFGIRADSISYDMEKIQNHKENTLETLRSGISSLLKKHKVTVYQGSGQVRGAHEVAVVNDAGDEILLEAEHILLASGSVPMVPPIPGAELPGVMTSDQLLDYRGKAFDTLVIIGGGVIGMEFASIYQALGTKVVVIEALDRILANLDKEIGQSLKMLCKKRGTEIHTGARVERLEAKDGRLRCVFREKDEEHEVYGDAVLMAVGRKPYTEDLFSAELQASGDVPDMERGRILTDDSFKTSIPSIYAIGDVIGGMQLAHTASAQGIWVAETLAGKMPTVHLMVVPSCVYTNPEIASTGLSVDDAKKMDISVKTAKYPMSANGKSTLTLQERGFIKVVYDADTQVILGAQMMCARATDMISEFSTAIVNHLTVAEMAAVMRPHPTFSEGITEVLRLV